MEGINQESFLFNAMFTIDLIILHLEVLGPNVIIIVLRTLKYNKHKFNYRKKLKVRLD